MSRYVRPRFLLLLVAAFGLWAVSAHPAQAYNRVYACVPGVEPSWDEITCGVQIDERFLYHALVATCRGATSDAAGHGWNEDGCTGKGGHSMWVTIGEFQDGDLVMTADGYGLRPWQSYAFAAASGDGGGDDGGDSEPFDPANIDLEKAGSAFSVGFIICGMCWAIGKGAGAIVRFVKRA